MDGQDWNTVTIRGNVKAPTRTTGKTPNRTPDAAAMLRLEREDTVVPKRLSGESRTEMMQRRAAMKKTQVEINQACSFPLHSIRDFESGKMCPSPSQLMKINRVLGTAIKYAV